MKPYRSSARTAPRSAACSKAKVVEATIGPDDRLAGARGQRRRVDRACREAQPALAHGRRPSPSRSGSVASGAGSKARPAAAAPSRSASPSPMWSARSGATPSRSRATRKTLGVGLRRSGLGRADDLGEEAGEPRLARGGPGGRRPSWRRTRARAPPGAAARARPPPRRAGGRRCCRRRRARTPPGRARRARARGRRPCSAGRGRRASPRRVPRGCAAGSRRPRHGRPPRPRRASRSTPRSASARRRRGRRVVELDHRPHRVDGDRVERASPEGIRVQGPRHALERRGDVRAGPLDEVRGKHDDAALLDRVQLGRARVLAEASEGDAAVRGGEVDLGVEAAQARDRERLDARGVPGDALAACALDEVAEERVQRGR